MQKHDLSPDLINLLHGNISVSVYRIEEVRIWKKEEQNFLFWKMQKLRISKCFNWGYNHLIKLEYHL